MEEGILWRRYTIPKDPDKYFLDQKHLVRATFLGCLGFPKANFGLNSGNPSSFPGGRLHPGDVFWGCKDSFVPGNGKRGSKEGEIANELPQLSRYILDKGVQGKTNAPSQGTEVPWYSFRLYAHDSKKDIRERLYPCWQVCGPVRWSWKNLC